MAFDLEQFPTRPRLKASRRDWAILAQSLERIANAASRDPKMRIGSVPELLKGVLPSNGVERRVLVETLGWLGILHPVDDLRWIDGWIDPSEQRPPPTERNDWPFPIHSWRGADGVDWDAVGRFFPQL